jgi:hypothetical protein
MKKKTLTVAMALLVALAVAGTAQALRIRAGDIVIVADGGFSPKSLPRDRDAPIELHGGGKISTVSGELPPILHRLIFEFDRHGHVETRGLGVCTAGRLQATTVPVARRNCPGAIVGKGNGHAIVKFPDQAPIPISSPITLFNGPKKGRNDTVLAHAYTDVPTPTTFVVPVVIQRIDKGVYGYRTEATIPKIAGGYGVPISGSLRIGRRWTFKGKRLSYVNARCATGHLQARGQFGFKDGTLLSGTFLRACTVRR